LLIHVTYEPVEPRPIPVSIQFVHQQATYPLANALNEGSDSVRYPLPSALYEPHERNMHEDRARIPLCEFA